MASVFFLSGIGCQLKAQNMETKTIFPKGEEFRSDKFTGKVWLHWLVENDEVFNLPIANGTFEPGCRNNWHKHPGGQILICTSGRGYYQQRGEPIRMLYPGDVVKIPPEVEHWHGATPDSWFSHIAIETNSSAGATVWLEQVTDEQYGSHQTDNSVNLTAAAIKNHDELWPDYKSRLKETDPELIEVFDNFAFDDVLQYGNLNTKTRIMMIAASNIACGALSEYKRMMEAALNVGVTPVEIKEILYQSVPYVGMARVLDFIHASNEILTSRGVEIPLPGQSTTTRETRFEKGLALQKEIVGDRIDKMYAASPPDQLHIQEYLSANCFGDYVARGGLDIKTRELLTFSMLISLGGCEPQVKGHILGNLNIGNDKRTLLSVVTQLIPYIGYPRALNAINCLNEIIP